jgi:hypothetical protein
MLSSQPVLELCGSTNCHLALELNINIFTDIIIEICGTK